MLVVGILMVMVMVVTVSDEGLGSSSSRLSAFGCRVGVRLWRSHP